MLSICFDQVQPLPRADRRGFAVPLGDGHVELRASRTSHLRYWYGDPNGGLQSRQGRHVCLCTSPGVHRVVPRSTARMRPGLRGRQLVVLVGMPIAVSMRWGAAHLCRQGVADSNRYWPQMPVINQVQSHCCRALPRACRRGDALPVGVGLVDMRIAWGSLVWNRQRHARNIVQGGHGGHVHVGESA